VVKVLIEAGTDIEKTTDDAVFYLNNIPMFLIGGRTPLHIACEKGYVKCVEVLLEAGADKTKKDFSERTPYDIAVNRKDLTIADVLCPGVKEHVAAVPSNPEKDHKEVRARVDRRNKLKTKEYRQMMHEKYKPLHTQLYHMREDFFDQQFLDAIHEGTPEALRSILTETHDRIYLFPMLNEDYCRMMLEELDNFEASGLPLKRPNSMNNYGVILNDVGFKDAMYELMHKYISPFARILFPDHGGESLDRHHTFMVKYKLGEDTKLAEHVDDAEVTLNVCLGKSFTGGELDFNGILGTPTSKNDHFSLPHKPGVGVLHLGRNWHSATPITSGERWNLIVWCRSSIKRGKEPKKCKAVRNVSSAH